MRTDKLDWRGGEALTIAPAQLVSSHLPQQSSILLQRVKGKNRGKERWQKKRNQNVKRSEFGQQGPL